MKGWFKYLILGQITLFLFNSCSKTEVYTSNDLSTSAVSLYRIGANSVINQMRQTSDGGFIFCGSCNKDTSTNADAFLMKTDANGKIEWQKTFGGVSNDLFYKVIQAADGGFVAVGYTQSFGFGASRGDYYSDAYMIKTDANGNMLWQKYFGSIYSDLFRDVVETSDHKFVAVGNGVFQDPSYGNSYVQQVYAVKVDQNGNYIWGYTYSGDHSVAQGYRVALFKNGQIALTGTVVKSDFNYDQGTYYTCLYIVSPNGSPILSSQVYNTLGNVIKVSGITNTGDGLVMGVVDSTNKIVLVKTDYNASVLWHKYCNPQNQYNIYSFASDGNGGFTIGGDRINDPSYGASYFMNVNSNGEVTGGNEFKFQNQIAYAAGVCPNKNGYSLGLTLSSSFLNYGSQFALMNIDKNGNLIDHGK